MRLRDLDGFQQIIIQCHDFPDADTIASGYGLYCYFQSKGKNVSLIYSGKQKVQKANLVLLLETLQIPLQYVTELEPPELLLTVDCQYKESNVTYFEAEQVATIDHHRLMGVPPQLSEIHSSYGSCATLVWTMLLQESFPISENLALSTALYYGLYSDTNSLSEISHPVDKDLRDQICYDQALMLQLRNSNLSLEEMQIAGEALKNYRFHSAYHFALVEVAPCDINILGFISDLMLQVNSVDICFVYCIQPFGLKFSVRSCVLHTHANELAEYLVDGLGSSGGHSFKSGGLIPPENLPPNLTTDYFYQCLSQYYQATEVIYADCYQPVAETMEPYYRKPAASGYLCSTEILPAGSLLQMRTLEENLDLITHEELYLLITINGRIRPIQKNVFLHSFEQTNEPFLCNTEFLPSITNLSQKSILDLATHIKICKPVSRVEVQACRLDHMVKIFASDSSEGYLVGKTGDYLVVSSTEPQSLSIVPQDYFFEYYQKI